MKMIQNQKSRSDGEQAQNKKYLKRKSILQSALDTIYEDKISGTSLRQIARRAGMSQGNLHYYFPTKENLFLALLDYLLETFIEERREAMASKHLDPQKKLLFFLDQEKEIILRKKEIAVFLDFLVMGTKEKNIRKKIQEMYSRWRSDIQSVIQEGIQFGTFSPGHSRLVPSLLVSIMDGAALQYLIDRDSIDLETYFSTARKLIKDILV